MLGQKLKFRLIQSQRCALHGLKILQARAVGFFRKPVGLFGQVYSRLLDFGACPYLFQGRKLDINLKLRFPNLLRKLQALNLIRLLLLLKIIVHI